MNDFRLRRHRAAGLFVPRERVRYKNSPQVPQPANPQVVAGQQTQSNVDTGIANATLGNVNQSGPLGSTTYNQTGGQWVDGNWVPSYTQTTSLNPTLQGILTGTENTAASLVPTGQKLADAASGSLTTPLNFSGANNNILRAGPQALDQTATSAIYGGETALLDPTFAEQKQQLQDQLSRQGIPVGSDAYNNAMTQLGTSQTQQRTAALGTATQGGITSANNMFNLALLGQNQGIQQQQIGQTNPLTNLSMLYGATGGATG